MASEKTGTTRRKSSTEPKVAASKAVVKTADKSKNAAVKTVTKATTRKDAASKAATKPAEKKSAAPRKTKATGQPISAEMRLRHIEIAAYYIAEQSGFIRNPGDCWIAAESDIDGLLLAGKLPA